MKAILSLESVETRTKCLEIGIERHTITGICSNKDEIFRNRNPSRRNQHDITNRVPIANELDWNAVHTSRERKNYREIERKRSSIKTGMVGKLSDPLFIIQGDSGGGLGIREGIREHLLIAENLAIRMEDQGPGKIRDQGGLHVNSFQEAGLARRGQGGQKENGFPPVVSHRDSSKRKLPGMF